MQRDDIIEYSLDTHHSEEAGRAIRRKIWRITLLLAVVTAIEVAVGAYWKEWFPGHWNVVRVCFIILTMIKAGYIVAVFMHLGEERRNIRAIILLPYALFVFYLVWVAIWESNYVNWLWTTFL
ncbi:MAG: cytochrome C oxidase subunit IV family protein [Flavobacteriales bacterium]|jgi:caa(3)-type oxidase subunit IV|nr:cytochrome C oxidase subunit IV family protein [Flavobacteriales bacterium]